MKTREEIERIFYPASIAVVGTNKVKGTVPCDILENILKDGYQGIIYPVNPKERSICGLRVYKYVIDIEDQVDLAVIVYPASVCHLAVEQCGQKGIKSMVIISAGFRETGPPGTEREKLVGQIANKYGISFIGPNCLGIINTDPLVRMNASFARRMPDEGNIAFVSQSGALCTAVLDYAASKHIGFSKFISFGNKAEINEIDLLNYLKDDPLTKVILLYLEEISDVQAFMEISRTIISQTRKPVLVLKAGRTPEGASAAASHTGALAGKDEICEAAFRQAGIIRCDDIEQMFNYAIAFAYRPLPKGNHIAIITNAGGPGVLTTDMAVRMGLKLSEFSEETTRTLKKNLPAAANIKNPVDVIGDASPERYSVALNAALNDDNVEAAMVILTPQSMTDIKSVAREISSVAENSVKPVLASFMGASDVAIGVDLLQKKNIPHYQLPENMCRAFACAYGFTKELEKKHTPVPRFADIDSAAVRCLLDEALAAGRHYLTETETLNILEACRLPVLPRAVVSSCSEALYVAADIGYPVVMKVVSDFIVHKSDMGGVVLNISRHEEAEEAYKKIIRNAEASLPKGAIAGLLVEKMVGDGQEVILGLKRDPQFGPVIMFGLGGIYVEVFKDVSFRIAPVWKESVREMITEIRSFPVLAGVRGKKPRDVESIETCIERLSQLALDFPEIKELDMNPLIVEEKGKGCFVADARIIL
ncbi:MAG: CoA-binding protein [Ignavibacteria bacterium]|jgi:acetyltransferase|nr:CoA-binding protein [Ignavibacteria bacterium]MCU7503294.1 CoA-binding protein [Ignavibacteria bacterium]MCU7515760.1 CoA-binding protein [Ignavibacteria bacterium]